MQIKIINPNVKIEHISFSKVFSKNSADINFRSPNTDKISNFYKCKHDLKDIITSMQV